MNVLPVDSLDDKNGFRSCSIIGVGSYVPQKILTNNDLEAMVETSDQWITERTGIKERRLAAENEFTSDLGAKASIKALNKAGIDPKEIDLIIVATITPDMPFPSTACWIQQKIGAFNAAAFDLEAACSGFIYALEIGRQFITTGALNTVLVVGAEKLSSIVDWEDRNTCVLFGDGAGAAVLQHRDGARGLISACLGADGRKAELLYQPGGGSRHPASTETISARLHYLKMNGKETFKCAINAMCNAAETVLNKSKVDISQVKLVIPHQANMRILDAIGKRLGISSDKLFINLHKYGNTSAASIAIALDEASESGLINKGDLILLVGFGAGFTWGAALLEW